MPAPSTRHAVPPLARYGHIASVLVKHGFGDVAAHLHIGRSLKIPKVHRNGQAAAAAAPMSRAARLRLVLEELGPTFVKFGQALSTREDVLPVELIEELTALQDHVAPLAPGDAERAIEAALGHPVASLFAAFDPVPVASASMAQVHRAFTYDGRCVAVKVSRPGIAATIERDLEALAHLADLAERHVKDAELYAPSALVAEFARTIRRELDLAREGHIIERFARNFAGDATVRIPHVYWQLTCPSVLTMEFIDGIKVSALGERSTADFDPLVVAQRGADAMLVQVLDHGLFHADPHPGNFLILPGNRIGLLDFGIVGRLDLPTRMRILQLVRALARRDADSVCDIVLELLTPLAEIDRPALRHDVDDLIDSYADATLGDVNLGEVLRRVVSALARHRLRFPSDLMLLVKALTTMESVGRKLAPDFRMLEHAAPLAERLWLARFEPSALTERAAVAGRRAAHAMRSLPHDVSAILQKVRSDRLQLQLVHRNLETFAREIDRSSNRLSFAIVIAALIVGSALVVGASPASVVWGLPALGWVGFTAAGVLGIVLAVGIMRSGKL